MAPANETLTDRFERSDSATIEHEGQTVRQIHRLDLAEGGRLQVRIVSHKADPPQTLNLDLENGSFLVEEQETPSVLLRTDTAPERTELVARVPGPTTVTIYNGWIGAQDESHAWFGEAGMVLDDKSGTITLRCSDGHDAPDFTDLVVELRLSDDA